MCDITSLPRWPPVSFYWLVIVFESAYFIEHIYEELSQSDLEASLNVVTINLHCYLEHQLLGSRLVGWVSKVNKGKALLPLSIENKCIHSGMGVGVTDWAQWQSTDLESVRLSSVLRARKKEKKNPPQKGKNTGTLHICFSRQSCMHNIITAEIIILSLPLKWEINICSVNVNTYQLNILKSGNFRAIIDIL